jgi:hypothetical protein
MTRQPSALAMHPALQLGDDRRDALLPQGKPLFGRRAVDVALDGEDRVDAAHRLDRQRRLAQIGEHEEFAPGVTPASSFGDRPRAATAIVEFGEPGIGVGLQNPSPARKMAPRMFAAAVAGVKEQRHRRVMTTERPVVVDISPQPPGDGLVLGQHRHRRVVAVQPVGGQHMAADQLDQRHQRGAACADPVSQGRGVQLDAFAGVNRTLPVQRLVLAELGVEDHRQQTRPSTGPRNRMERRRWLGNPLARAAGELLAHRLDHLPLARHYLQGLGDVLAELGEPATADRASAGRRNDDALARQMCR